MNCTVTRNKSTNEILEVLDPNGNISKLYKELVIETNNKEEALDLYYLSMSEQFRRDNGKSDWLQNEYPLEPSMKEVINFDEKYRHIRKEAEFNTGINLELNQQKRFLELTMEDLESKINSQVYKENKKYLKTVRDQLDRIKFKQNIIEYDKVDTYNAILSTVDYNINEMAKLRTRMKTMQDINFHILKGDELKNKEQELVDFLYHCDLFLQSYSRIENLDLTYFENDNIGKLKDEINKIIQQSKLGKSEEILKDDEIKNQIDDIIKESIEDTIDNKISILISMMKDSQRYIDNMQNVHKDLFNKHIKRHIMKHSTNPKIINNTMKFMDEQYDENRLQLLFDALADTHNPLVANTLKLYTIMEHNRDEDIKTTTREFNNKLKNLQKLYGNKFDEKLNMLFEKEDGNLIGRFVQQFKQGFKDEYWNRVNKLGDVKAKLGEHDDKYLLEKEEHGRWLRNNTLQEYDDRWLKVQNMLSSDARVERGKLYIEKNDILKPYLKTGKDENTYYNLDELKDDDLENLRIVESKIVKLGQTKEFKNNKLVEKKGKSLQIAKSIEKYNELLQELNMYESVNINEYKDELKKAKEKSSEEYATWLDKNTYQYLTDEYYKLAETEKISFPNEIQSLFDNLHYIVKPYKKFGDVYVDLIPENEMKFINKIQLLIDNFFNSNEAKQLFEGKTKKLNKLKVATNYFNLMQRKGASISTLDNKSHPLYYRYVPSNISIGDNVILYPQEPRANYKITKIKDEFKTNIETKDKAGEPIPVNKYITKQYNNLQKDVELNKFYDYITGLLLDMMSHYEGTLIHKGYLPALTNEDINNWELILHGLGCYNKPDQELVSTNMKDEIIKNIPLNFIKFLGDFQKQYRIPKFNSIAETYFDYQQRIIDDFNIKFPDINATDINDIRNYNNKISKQNRINHGKEINYDLKTIIPLFIRTALNHKHKSGLKNELALVKNKLMNDRFIKTNGIGMPLKKRSRVKDDKDIYTVKGMETNTMKHFNMWMDMVFYEDFEKNEGYWTKVARVIQNYTSIKGIGLNPFSGLNNIVYGKIQMALEAGGNYYFNKKEWLLAKKDYIRNIVNILADLKSDGVYSSLESAFVTELNIMENQDEKAESLAMGKTSKMMHKFLMITNAAYIFQHLGEHNMQNQTLFAMLRSHRLINGKVMSFIQYKDGFMEKVDIINKTKEENSEIIAKNRLQGLELKKRFEQYPMIRDIYELDSNKALHIKTDVNINEGEIALFKGKVITVNQKMHGIYSKRDAGTMQHVAIGRLAIHFRKWLPEGLNKRFYGITQTKIKDRIDWNERRAEQKEGMYISTAKLLTMPYKIFRKDNNVFKAAILTILEDFKMFAWKNNMYWHSLNETQKANVRRTMIEFAEFIGIIILTNLVRLAGGKWDEDDKYNKFGRTYAYNILMYQLDRTITEIRTYSVYGVINEGKKLMSSPAASINSVEQLIKLVSIAFQYPFWDDKERKYIGGAYAKQDKLLIATLRNIPFLTHGVKAAALRKHMEYYKRY